MAIDVTKITKSRQADRDKAKNSGSDERIQLELQYIADALEAIRGEIVGLSHGVGTTASRPSTGEIGATAADSSPILGRKAVRASRLNRQTPAKCPIP